ncbi:helix-turn-helix domain-containing protein [Paenibacillus lautus]|uniref:helix-turn-helix transcriptional regulator n=1 Tax=Paenibacillus TaxID=44249 RepID=UPI002DB635DA|nr:helix-turn-helix domain-containing protein [Paenibacillus lautus]MEC0256307.1 helix-turn-helix domain-containing protein [Paenibacillus lautus]MEC0310599.1 helix-turn-helix domain-containing protein [Paenibacillus lautus]
MIFQFTAPPLPHYMICGEDTYQVGDKHPDRYNIGVFDLILVTRGTLFLEENGVAYRVKSGCHLILRPDAAHRTYLPCQEETHFYWLHFQTLGRWIETEELTLFALSQTDQPYVQIESFSFYIPKYGELPTIEQARLLIEQLQNLQQSSSSASRWKQQQLLHELLLLFQAEEEGIQHQNPQYAIAERTANYLRQHYKEPVSYQQLSDAMHFHQNYLSICMKKTFGCTPLEFLTRHRIEQAKQMLIHTNDPIGRIAEESGFGSFPYFIRCFVRYTGFKPKSFRQKYRS